MRSSGQRGFSLVELMVVMAIIAILLALLMPGLQAIRSTTYRVLSASNQRTLGQGITIYAGPRRGRLPESRVLLNEQADLGELMRTYAPLPEDPSLTAFGDAPGVAGPQSKSWKPRRVEWYSQTHGWDGLGHLFALGLVPEAAVFYSPGHRGDHSFDRYEEEWVSPIAGPHAKPSMTIYGNYHYAGHLFEDGRTININRDPAQIIVTDGLRRRSDLTHREGLNVLRGDGSVEWIGDQLLRLRLPESSMDSMGMADLNGVIRDVFSDFWKLQAGDGDDDGDDGDSDSDEP